MSKKNNVNPNFYKVGGREHSEGHGEAIPHDLEKQKFERASKRQGSKEAPASKKKSD
jgi:hypothetical protein